MNRKVYLYVDVAAVLSLSAAGLRAIAPDWEYMPMVGEQDRMEIWSRRVDDPDAIVLSIARCLPRGRPNDIENSGQAWLDELCTKPPPTRLRIFKGGGS